MDLIEVRVRVDSEAKVLRVEWVMAQDIPASLDSADGLSRTAQWRLELTDSFGEPIEAFDAVLAGGELLSRRYAAQPGEVEPAGKVELTGRAVVASFEGIDLERDATEWFAVFQGDGEAQASETDPVVFEQVVDRCPSLEDTQTMWQGSRMDLPTD